MGSPGRTLSIAVVVGAQISAGSVSVDAPRSRSVIEAFEASVGGEMGFGKQVRRAKNTVAGSIRASGRAAAQAGRGVQSAAGELGASLKPLAEGYPTLSAAGLDVEPSGAAGGDLFADLEVSWPEGRPDAFDAKGQFQPDKLSMPDNLIGPDSFQAQAAWLLDKSWSGDSLGAGQFDRSVLARLDAHGKSVADPASLGGSGAAHGLDLTAGECGPDLGDEGDYRNRIDTSIRSAMGYLDASEAERYLAAGLTYQEIVALYLYTTDHYMAMNAILRGQAGANESSIAAYEPWIQLAQRGLAKLPTGVRNDDHKDLHDPGAADDAVVPIDTVYRSDMPSKAFDAMTARWEVGQVIRDGAMLSTSTVQGSFGNEEGTHRKISGVSKLGGWIVGLSDSKHEHEFLLPPGTSMQIDDMKRTTVGKGAARLDVDCHIVGVPQHVDLDATDETGRKAEPKRGRLERLLAKLPEIHL